MSRSTKQPTAKLPGVERLNALLLQLAKLCDVPSALVMRVHTHDIEVFAAADTGETPYRVGDKEDLNSGFYCEYVMAKKTPLLVPDATQDADWRNNPDVKLGMISYLGYPLKWPDGKIFGTICILDRKANTYSPKIQSTVDLFRTIVEDQLALLHETQRAKDALAALEANRQELSQAVRLAVDATVKKAKLVESVSKDLSRVLEALAPFLDEPSATIAMPTDLRGPLLDIVTRINHLSGELTQPADTLDASAYKKRTH